MIPPLVLYVLGEPGVGKTSMVRQGLHFALAADASSCAKSSGEPVFTEPPHPKWTIAGGVCAAGHYKGTPFDGADTIPYNGALAALEYWNSYLRDAVDLTILDGARFATRTSLAYLRGVGAHVIGVHLVSPKTAAERRAARCAKHGTEPQNPSWVKGAATGARNFATMIGAVDIDAAATTLVRSGRVHAFIERARAALREAA